jgi:hypothetical protein
MELLLLQVSEAFVQMPPGVTASDRSHAGFVR